MIRAKVFSNEASTWLAYDDGIPAAEINAPMIAPNIPGKAISTAVGIEPKPATSKPILPSAMAYHPHLLSNPSLITETETAAGYNLYRGTTSNPYGQGLKINDGFISTTSYDDWGTDTYGPIVNGTTYYYQVSAIYDIGGSYVEVGPSEEFTGTPANRAPTAPVNLLGTLNDHNITLSWDANTDYDIAAYNIYRRDYNADIFNLVGTVDHPTVTYSEDITIDGIYRYKIKAVDAGGMESEEYSNYVDFSVGLIPPGITRASTDLEFEIKINWAAPGGSGLISDTEDLNVAVIHSDDDGAESELMEYLTESGIVTEYTVIECQSNTPTLNDLEPYDMAIIWTNNAPYDYEAMGDVLADFVDLGKPVLAFNFCFIDYYLGLGGRFMEDYSPMAPGYCEYMTASLGEYDETSPLMANVTELSEFYYSSVSTQNNGQVVAYWDYGYPAVAYSPDYPIVCINGYVGTYMHQWGGDMMQLTYNAVNYLKNYLGTNPDGYKLYKSDSESGDFELFSSLAGNVKEYIDSPVPNGVPYYYQVTAIWDSSESGPSNTVEGYGQNYAPEIPTGLTASVNERIVNLTWAFTDSMSDFDHYNVYRMISGENDWNLISTSTVESYTEEITGEDAVYKYCVTAVDNGDPQLESTHSHPTFAPVGSLPPYNLSAASDRDAVVPLSWAAPDAVPCTTFVYDDGVCNFGVYFYSTLSLYAKQFTGLAPVQICTVYVHIITEGDTDWPWPDGQHDPSLIQIWDDNGLGQPGTVIAETTATCELGEWLVISFSTPVTCNTNNFWVSWTNAEYGSYDALGLDVSGGYLEREWYRENSVWYNAYINAYDTMIRAAITIDGVAELLTEDNPISESSVLPSSSDDPQLYDTEEMLGYYIYRSTSPDVPIDDAYRITPAYITDTQYSDEAVTNGTTYYYIAVAAYDNNGVIEYSTASNEVSATPVNPGMFAVNPASLTIMGEGYGEPVTTELTLTNDGGLPVTFSVSASVNNSAVVFNTDVDYAVSSEFTIVNAVSDKSNTSPEESNPPIIASSGGPDIFGYIWIDSDEPNGPEYSWVDISDIGNEITDFSDDTNLGPYDLGFDFSYYGITYSTFRVCSNGWLSFTSDWADWTNLELPSANAPYNMIAPFWDDLGPQDGSEFYYYTNSVDSMVMSWIDIPTLAEGDFLTFQVILTADGAITLQYADIEPDGSFATVGIQNADGSDGLQISYDSSYLHSNMAIKISTGWLSVTPVSGTIPAGGSLTINAICDPGTLGAGTYYGTLAFAAYDMNHDLEGVDVPVELEISYIDAIDDNVTLLPTVFSLDQNYPNPFNAKTEIKYALPIDSDVKLEIYNVLGQKVTTLVDEQQAAGYHSLIWDGTNESGQVVASGMYLYKLVTNEDTFVKKMVMLK